MLAKPAESSFPPERPFRVRAARRDILAAPFARRGSLAMRWCCCLSGASVSTAPRRAASRRARQTRTRRCTPQGGSRVASIKCGRPGPWSRASRKEAGLSCARRRGSVRRLGLGRLPAAVARSAWRWGRGRWHSRLRGLSGAIEPSAGAAELEGEILRRGWGLVLRVVRRRASSGFRFVFSHCGVPHATGIVTGEGKQVRSEVHRAFEEGWVPRTQLSALLDHARPAPKHTKGGCLSGPLLARSGAGTSKHFGWPRGVPARKADRLGCRWRGARNAGCDPAICARCGVVRARRRAGAVRPVKAHGLGRGRALAPARKARRAALMRKNGCACRVCGDAFGRQGVPAEHVPQRPSGAAPACRSPRGCPGRGTHPTMATRSRAWCARLRGAGTPEAAIERQHRGGSWRTWRRRRGRSTMRSSRASGARASSRALRGSLGTSAKQPPP
ncbi:hypothetical protein ERJ75_000335700 [Trypanosoma vivax]|nr:hypothetical protein ERJ75_000335700 [Trypanosoma vivax]